MKRALTMTALVAVGLLAAASFATAQEGAATSGGQVTFGALGVKDISSSKFQEYRDVPKGLSIPFANLFATSDKVDFNLNAYNVRQGDQRYTGSLSTPAFGVTFDYNQTPHNMGNDARVLFSEVGEGAWAMSASLRQYLGGTADATLPTTARNVTFYEGLLGPTFAAAGSVDLTSLRKRGNVELDLGKRLPFSLVVSYMRELKSGYRGQGGGDILGAVSPVIDLPEPLNELTQDFGFRAALNRKWGNVHAAFNRNLYNNRAETLTIDNPFQPRDVLYTAAAGAVPALGGPAQAFFVNAPDNEATTGSAGFLLKFARQTRIGGEMALSSWTQNAPFYPYTLNSTVLTTSGAKANLTSSLQQPSLDGKINTTMVNLTFSSRPAPGLGIRASFRSYDLTNKTTRFVITGDVSGSPDRSWSAVTATAADPYGHATANVYDTTSRRFSGSVSYDIKGLTLEAAGRATGLTRTSREADKGKDNGVTASALYHASDLVGFRASYDYAKRTAEGATVYGFQSDEAERVTKRAGVDLELTPTDTFGVTLAYLRRDVEYPNRPDRVQVSGGVPVPGAAPIPNTPSGLLSAKYDSYTIEAEFTPNERAEVGAYFTYEKDAQTNQWSTTTGANLNNLLNYAGSDKTNTFGVNAILHLVPEKWTFSLNAMRQKVDGLMDITAREAGTFYTPGRTTLIAAGQGGAADITDWDDTTLTTVVGQLDYAVAKSWVLSLGYWFEKYEFSDAFTSGIDLMPQSILIFMKPDSGSYKANVAFAKLNYRF